MYRYVGKTALITGASSGIGEAFAQILAARVFARVMRPRKQEAKPGGERSATPLASRSRP